MWIKLKQKGTRRMSFGGAAGIRILPAAMVMALSLGLILTGLFGAGSAWADESRKGQAPSDQQDAFDYSSQSLRIGVWIEGKQDQDILQKGEKFAVGFQANEDAYAVVYHIDSGGEVSVLWPRARYDDGFVFGGHEYLLPVSGSRRLNSGQTVGEGFVEAIVSSYPFDLRDLELDFHHQNSADPYNFQVAGDPFLAMNEVNYVITGLEDSGEYVVTNYVSYYVHQQVDHPRYLCNQCHFEDDVAYDPYQDDCTLDIEYDYGWSNTWYDNYGYYPVYSNPVYVYVDPWSYRPWVNFWYDPWYRCAPGWGWGSGWGSCYSWHDSPYYWGDADHYYNNGHRRWRPLDRSLVADARRTKIREYGRVTSLVGRDDLSDRERSAMRSRTSLADNRRTLTRDRVRTEGSGHIRGEERRVRDRLRIDTGTTVRANGGLRIRDNRDTRVGGDNGRPPRRHTAGGSSGGSALTPVRRDTRDPGDRGSTVRSPRSRENRDGDNRVRDNRVRGDRSRADKPAGDRVRREKPGRENRTIKPVEPRRKGTRVWNTRPENNSESRSQRRPSVNRGSNRERTPTVKPGRDRGSRSNKPAVRSKPGRQRESGSRSEKPKSTPRVKSGGSKQEKSSSNSGSSRSSGGRSSSSSRKGSGRR